MKAVQAKDLVIGAIYSDSDLVNKYSTFLKYKGEDELGDPLFFYVGGEDGYTPEYEDGSFSLSSFSQYAELSPSEIEQYLPSLSTDN